MLSWFEWLAMFVFLYPGLMAVYWTMSGTLYFLFSERNRREADYAGDSHAPMVSVLIPCFNEAKQLSESIPYLLALNYPDYELLFINDGSSDETGKIIDEWASREPKIRALHQENTGKASALNYALQHARGSHVVCIDGDAILDPYAVDYIVQTLEEDSSLGGVTGNPRVRNRSTVLGRMQVAEFSAIIGLIKRSQSILGTLFTVSGVICAFRQSVLKQVGGWRTNMVTEDIDISWRVQLAGFNIAYEPRALCWVLMPETIFGLLKQRLRWAQGGAEVIGKYANLIWRWDCRRLWPLYLEYVLTAFWAYAMSVVMLVTIYRAISTDMYLDQFFVQIHSALLLLFFLIQFLVSLLIDRHYEKGVGRYFLISIWYPYVYWMMGALTLVVGIPKAILRNQNHQAVWRSPDRGV